MEPMINIALRAARKVGENIVRASDDLDRFEVIAKGVNDFVTEVDIKIQVEVIKVDIVEVNVIDVDICEETVDVNIVTEVDVRDIA